jgi:hypothetical protein
LAAGRQQRISPPSGTGMPVGLPVSRSLIGCGLRVLVRSNCPGCPASTRRLRCACHKLKVTRRSHHQGPCRVRTDVRCCRDHAIHLCHRRNSSGQLPQNFGTYGILSSLTAAICARDIALPLNEDN